MKLYRKKGLQPARPYIPGEDLTGVSVSDADKAEIASGVIGGMIAHNPANSNDRWYIAKQWFEDHYEQVTVTT